MHDNARLTEARIRRVLTERLPRVVDAERAPVSLAAWTVPGEPVPFAEAAAADYRPFRVGEPWGRAWSTWWFDVRGTVPASWAGREVELLIDPGFHPGPPGMQAEGLVFRPDGTAVKGLHPRNAAIPVDVPAGENVRFLVELAANPDIIGDLSFTPTPFGSLRTAPATPLHVFRSADLVVVERDVRALALDLEVLFQMVLELPETDPRRHEVREALNDALDELRLDDVVGSAPAARARLAPVLASPAAASSHRMSAVGHAHIDSAWLWPLRETRRKVGRTFANALALMEAYPEFRFAGSQAQQYVWVRERHPDVWAGVQEAVRRGQWLPVGSMWVEPDGVLPGAEAMVRQLVYGKRFFLDEFGVETRGVWLPDSFGYSAALPQLAVLAGAEWFLTQKLSWNRTNVFPHHTLRWEGIDGTRIFTHFPPSDTYNATLQGDELHAAVARFKEKGRATRSLIPFGYGDGGGGPTREMLERARRTRDLEGSPRVVVEGPDEFFAAARAEYPDAPVWVGELYLELHRGTFTSQARGKRGNRDAEHLLREAELWAASAAVLAGADYPYAELERLWKTTLLQQFHDILPGSSIRWVHEENEETYTETAAATRDVIDAAQQRLAAGRTVFNTVAHDRVGVLEDEHGAAAALVAVPGGGSAAPDPVAPAHPVVVRGRTFDNGLVRVAFGEDGTAASLVDVARDRELIAAGRRGNLLQLHADLPIAWDAWDVDQHDRARWTDVDGVESFEIVESGPLRASARVTRSFGRSRIVETLSVAADSPQLTVHSELDWAEDEKLLKASFPLAIHAQHSSSETQFGHVRRPTHTNTSWEDARFELAAHRWIHVEEPGASAAIVNRGTAGHDVTRGIGEDGLQCTDVRLSLVRAARYPDPEQDLGHHVLDYAVVVGVDIPGAVRAGHEFNLPVREATGSAPSSAPPLVSLDGRGVSIEAVKLADDRGGDVVVRLGEITGGRSDAVVRFPGGIEAADQTDLLERPLGPGMRRALAFERDGDAVRIALAPFQVLTLRVRPSRGARSPAAGG